MKKVKKVGLLPLLVMGLLMILTCSCEKDLDNGTVTDLDLNLYQTVKIGDQWWMSENLKTTKFNDGIDIAKVEGNSAWNILSGPGYCWYNNDEAGYKETYGALYNWYTVSSGRLCPSGWHVPSNSEWSTLEEFLGGTDLLGSKLREEGTVHWKNPAPANNETGFTALPGGYRNYNGDFLGILDVGGWSSATEKDTRDAWGRGIWANNQYDISFYWKTAGSSVRCIKD